MNQIYKNVNIEDKNKEELFSHKYRSDNYIDNHDLMYLICSSIEQIQSMFDNSLINSQFFSSINDLQELVIKDKPQFIPILIDSQIIHYLFLLYHNGNIENEQIVLNFMVDFTSLDFSICEIFLQENFIQLLKSIFTNKNDESDLYLIQIFYNILHSINQQEVQIYNSILHVINQQFSLREFFSLAQKIDSNNDVLCYVFLCFYELMKHTIEDIKDEDVIYEMVHYYFFDRKLYQVSNLKIQKAFPQNCLSIINNRIVLSSFNYELFDYFQLFLFIDFYLKNPPIENFSITCHIISLLIIKYNCDYQFDIKAMIDAYVSFNSNKNQFYSVNAMNCLIRTNNLLSEYFFENNCSLFFFFIDSFYKISSKTKPFTFQLILYLLEISNTQIWSYILKNSTLTNEADLEKEEQQQHICLFNIISDSLEFEELKNDSIRMLFMIFQRATEMKYLKQCYALFNDVFNVDFNDKFNNNDENVRLFFQTYFK